MKMPAPIRPTPNNPISTGAQIPPPSRRSRERKPTAKAIINVPVTMKFVICIQPRSPIDSELTGCRQAS
ncbi:MAG TPA: hypothetical protein VHN80_27085 [Kineosporiaceae bacterium]|nr:hypothetical protein [Kineosporiaceae bacterium]